VKNGQCVNSEHGSSAQLLEEAHCLGGQEGDLFSEIVSTFGIEPKKDAFQYGEISTSALTVGLVGCYRFSQECLIKALENLHPQLTIVPFATVADCIAERRTDLDLIIYYSHHSQANGASDAALTHHLSALGQAFPAIPLVVLSDADDAQRLKNFRDTLKSGAHGFIPTRTTGIPIAIAALRLIKAGGTFAPMDLMLANANRTDDERAQPDTVRQRPLTSRQMVVLAHLRRGSANKIIAHELDMSESTVKVHVRNIMRKVGATNRTQAVYKAQKLLENAGFAKTLER
jgi:DNA-binding NarL/FixJ family response regulator